MNYKILLQTGTEISCTIGDVIIDHAIIFRKHSAIWICQNVLSGVNSAPNDFGFKYSWYQPISKLDKKDCPVQNIKIIGPDQTVHDNDDVIISYCSNGVVYNETCIGGRSIAQLQSGIETYTREINEKQATISDIMDEINYLKELIDEEQKLLKTHKLFARRGWSFKEKTLKK